jgi:hypothetical protein
MAKAGIFAQRGRYRPLRGLCIAIGENDDSYLLAPADGEKLIARGKVVRPGRTLIVTQAVVLLCALMQQTIMVMHGKAGKTGAVHRAMAFKPPWSILPLPRQP